MNELSRRRSPGLGRGLSALFGDAAAGPGEREPGSSDVRSVAIEDIKPHPDQPRRHFDADALAELAGSIAAQGVLQPIVVRPHERHYQIVAGERRWRAARQAGLAEIPVIVRDIDEATTLELALIENIQRQDLNPLEEAEAYRRLIGEFGHTQEQLGKLVHKSRSHVANLMRLLDLPEEVRTAVAENRLSMGHARAVATSDDPVGLARVAIERGLSVRAVEQLMKARRSTGRVVSEQPAEPVVETAGDDAALLARHIEDALGLAVSISHGDAGGSVVIRYATVAQLDLICQRLTGGEPVA